jgi:hypothetical protein
MAYKQRLNSREKDTPGTFRKDQEDRYKNIGKIPGTEDVYKFVSDTGKTRFVRKQGDMYSILYTDPKKSKVYTQ